MFVGNFIGVMVSDFIGFNDGPLWAAVVGVFFGCLVGIVVPKAILRNSSTMGLNRVSHHQQLLGDVAQDELELIIAGKETVLNFMAKKAFLKIDTNESNTVEDDEIKAFLKNEQGEDYNEETFQRELQSIWKKNHSGEKASLSLSEFTEVYKEIARDM